jgi:putative flavoprotein involved in K+ transport
MRASRRHNGRDSLDWVRVAVVGAGPAGLAVSGRLADAGCSHVVLERGRIGWSWRTQRWDSFRLNTPTWANLVPGGHLVGPPDGFASASALVAGLERFADRLPVFEGVEVRRAERVGQAWRLETSRGALLAGAVVVASGFQNVPSRPDFADALPPEIEQLHVADYRRPGDLQGPVLVVGGGQSGLQIAEDLLAGGHRAYLSTSRVGRLPRRYRGRDAFEWLRDTGQLDVSREEAEPATLGATVPQISGAAGGRTVSYQQLAARGATLLGRATACNGRRLRLAPDVGENVRFADEVSSTFRAAWDKRAALGGREAESTPERDTADQPAPRLYGLRGPDSLDLGAAGISTVIWATGFDASVAWLPAGALDLDWHPRLPNLHVVGAPWLTHRASANLYGMASDADRVVAGFAELGVAAA